MGGFRIARSAQIGFAKDHRRAVGWGLEPTAECGAADKSCGRGDGRGHGFRAVGEAPIVGRPARFSAAFRQRIGQVEGATRESTWLGTVRFIEASETRTAERGFQGDGSFDREVPQPSAMKVMAGLRGDSTVR